MHLIIQNLQVKIYIV